MKVKVKRLSSGNILPANIHKGDWIDLYTTSEAVNIEGPQWMLTKKENGVSRRAVHINNYMIPLGIAMELPKGFEAVVLPRSGLYNKYGVMLANSEGVIDNAFCGNDDQWFFNAVALRDTTIPAYTRICQFRIQLSQKATFWQKVKWLFSSKIKFVEVDNLNNNNRGGFGSTGDK